MKTGTTDSRVFVLLPCAVDDCERASTCRGFCKMHYQRWKKHGDPEVRTITHTRRPAGAKSPDKDEYWHSIWTAYRLTIEQWEALFRSQDKRCAICRKKDPGKTRTGRAAWQVDHDHACCPGVRTCGACVRGIICPTCNSMVLRVIEGPHYEAALDYLARYDHGLDTA